jgi:hypothetical protein
VIAMVANVSKRKVFHQWQGLSKTTIWRTFFVLQVTKNVSKRQQVSHQMTDYQPNKYTNSVLFFSYSTGHHDKQMFAKETRHFNCSVCLLPDFSRILPKTLLSEP